VNRIVTDNPTKENWTLELAKLDLLGIGLPVKLNTIRSNAEFWFWNFDIYLRALQAHALAQIETSCGARMAREAMNVAQRCWEDRQSLLVDGLCRAQAESRENHCFNIFNQKCSAEYQRRRGWSAVVYRVYYLGPKITWSWRSIVKLSHRSAFCIEILQVHTRQRTSPKRKSMIEISW
jgi:hypothetical protein